MERKPGTQTVYGVEIPPEQRTPLVEALLRVIDQLEAANAQLRATVEQQQLRIDRLEDEVRRLKGLPDKPKRKPGPSPLNDPSGPPSASAEKKKPNTPDGKRPGSAKRCKTRELTIHKTEPLRLNSLPDGTRFLGYLDFIVQDLRLSRTTHATAAAATNCRTERSSPLPCHRTSNRISVRRSGNMRSTSIFTTTSPSRCCTRSCWKWGWTSQPARSIAC